jgi:methylenetetrahydrofolate dehydrogenase (NADP+)/methenyltetrahydrofolate cyclohydrolase
MSTILDGKTLAKQVEQELSGRVAAIVQKTNITPKLAILIVGDDYASHTYVKMKMNACKRVGIEPVRYAFPDDAKEEEILAVVNKLAVDPTVHGIMLQHPIPKHLNERKIMDSIPPSKDSDGLNSASFGAMALGLPAFAPATALSIMTLLRRYNQQIEGKKAVVIGRSSILGKPVALMLLNDNATVTICHSKTQKLPEIVSQADIVVAAVGKPKFVKAEWIKPGAVIVDAGYNEGNIGDVDLENAAPKSSAYTPVPGGVGPMTIAMLLEQTVMAAEAALLK